MTPADVARELLAAAPDAGLLLDFDGTLAPIVDDPRQARLPDGVADVLARLADALALVAVVSGRPAAFLAEQVRHHGVRLLGLYGLEQWVAGEARTHPDAAAWQAPVREAVVALSGSVGGEPGIWVEDKGLSVAVHWRTAPDRAAAEAEVGAAVAELSRRTGLVREPGKLVEELRPPLAMDKGAAVRALGIQGLACSVYLGDDRGDLAAFATLREAGGRCIAVQHGEETPAELVDAADTVLEARAVHGWLAGLADALG